MRAETPEQAAVRDEVTTTVLEAMAATPRSQQVELGPSEIGEPCLRRTAYKLLGAPRINPLSEDMWLATIGTATHRWLEDAFTRTEELWTRWLVELTVTTRHAGLAVTGHVDALGPALLDWKVVGVTTIRQVRKDGQSSIAYRVQNAIYRYGAAQEGHDSQLGAIVYLPKSAPVREALWDWQPPLDEAVQLARWALERHAALVRIVAEIGKDALAKVLAVYSHCEHCPFRALAPVEGAPLSDGCPGLIPAGRRSPGDRPFPGPQKEQPA